MTVGERIRWGVAATASGSLGVASRSDWGGWEAEGRLPDSGGGNGFGEDFGSDLALLASIGVRSMRWTVDWARLEPRPGHWDEGFAHFVVDVLRAARAEGIDVWAVLHEGPLPGWFSEDDGGFHDPIGRRRTWPRHVDRVAETFGDLVAAWVPVLDPFTIVADGYLDGRRPPGRSDELRFSEALQELHLVSHEAMRLLRSGDPLVACCVDVEPAHVGVRTREPDERDAARSRAASADRLRVGTWLRALHDGVVSVPGRAELEIDGLAGGYDVVGLTYRGARTVFADGTDGPYPADAPVAADGRAPWTEGLGEVLRRLGDELPGRRLVLLGTGLTDAADDWRGELLQGTDAEMRAAIDDGVPVTDAFWESGIDGWTPACGLTVPDGVISRARDRRPSADAFHEVATGHGKLAS